MSGSDRPGRVRWCFDDVEIDLAAMDVRRAGVHVGVEPQVFDVLRILIENRDRVVPKEELLDAVWGSRFVSESALTTRIRSARVAVGDDGRSQRVIRTVHGRGYQFVATLDEEADDGGDDGPAPEPEVTEADALPGADGAHRIAAPVKTLVDRTELSARLRELVAPGRVVTLVGPAGVGKSHLAHHVAAALAPAFGDGSWVVRLAEVRSAGAAATAVLDALRATRYPSGSAEDTVVGLLAPADALLLLDNCEHVLTDVAALVGRLVAAGARVAVLATSRRRLAVPGEVVVDVPVLGPAHGAELFRQRAAENGVDVTRAERIDEVCAALDQLPLALELACARARVLGVDQLAALLDDRLRILGSLPGDPAQITLEGAIEASWAELDAELQETLGRFAQFAGWFDLSAATTVACAERDLDPIEAVNHVVALGERSLIEVDTESIGSRYRLLESIRLFADARLVEHDAARRAHVGCHRDRAVQYGHDLAGPDVELAWHDIRNSWTDLRAAIRYALDLGLVEAALDILSGTADYAEVALAFEHGLWADEVLAAAGRGEVSPEKVREVRAGRARLLSYERRLDDLEALVAEAGDPEASYSVALATFWRAGAAGDRDGIARNFRLLERHTAGTGGIRELTVGAVAHLAAHSPEVDPSGAGARAQRVGRSTGELGGAFSSVIEANVALREGREADALEACDRCLALAGPLGLAVLSSQAQALRVRAVRSDPDVRVVGRRILEAMRFYRARGNWASARNDAPVAARVVAEAGLRHEAVDVLDGYRPVRYRSPDRAYLESVYVVVGASPDDHEEALDAGRPEDASPRFCDLVIAALERALVLLGEDVAAAGGVGHRARSGGGG